MTRAPRRLSPPYLIGSRVRHRAEVLAACVPERVGGYVEPYLDSGVVALTVLQGHPDAFATLASTDADLVCAWEVVRDRPGELVEALAFHAERNRAAYFAAVREEDSGALDEVGRAARYIYLRGVAAPGAGGELPGGVSSFGSMGDRRFGREEFAFDPAGIRALSRLLGEVDVSFVVRSPFELLPEVREGDLVLLDPPFGSGGAMAQEARSFVNAATARGALVLAPAPRSVEEAVYAGWPGMAVLNEEGDGERGEDAVWGSGALRRLLRAERREGR